MAKGIIYCASTIVPGLVKIGKTNSDGFNQRMYNLERNGYNNVVGLKREFAIEVEDYDEKENLIHNIFSKSRVGNSELFSINLDLVTQLLSSFEGKQIYPEDETKEAVFSNVADKLEAESIPDGEYYILTKSGKKAILRKENETLTLLKGSFIATTPKPSYKTDSSYKTWVHIQSMVDKNYLLEDVTMPSVSRAAGVVLARSSNGWIEWKNKNGKPIDIYRNFNQK